jgi:hypothetical protein
MGQKLFDNACCWQMHQNSFTGVRELTHLLLHPLWTQHSADMSLRPALNKTYNYIICFCSQVQT